MYDSALKALTYEQKREVMGYFPVTSLMSKGQLSKYLDEWMANTMGASA